MMRLLLAMLALFVAVPAMAMEDAAHPEARPFAEDADAQRAVSDALQAAVTDGRNAIVVMGANWCHDSRALAGWFAMPRFAEMLDRQYHVVYVDAGTPQTGKGRNLDIAKRFGITRMKGTPLVIISSPNGKILNSAKDAKSWRNAASRSADDIYRYFADFSSTQK